MPPDLFPLSTLESRTILNPRRWRPFFRSNGTLRIRFISAAFILTGLIVYLIVFSIHTPPRSFPVWYLSSKNDTYSVEHPGDYEPVINPKLTTLPPNPSPQPIIPDDPPSPSPSATVSDDPPPPSPSSSPDVLTVEQIRDIVASTRGFFSRDYNLELGWNNVRYIFEAALLQAELLNRTLVLPSFVYARACEYENAVCADYATMVNRGDAMGSDEWRELPIEQQMAFRIQISVMVNMTHLRNRQPVITASEYLRLHGQDPDDETSDGFWHRDLYHTQPNIFEANKTKTPSLFIIENHWYGPKGTNRVDYIPEAMKKRGNLDLQPGPDHYDGSSDYWPTVETTEQSGNLHESLLSRGSSLDWDVAKSILVNSPDLVGDVNFDDDEAVEEVLNAHGWEVLHTFPGFFGMELAKIVVGHVRQVVPRSSIRGLKDDYHQVDADVILIDGDTHQGTKPGAMLFTEETSRKRYASKVVHSLIPPQRVFDLAEVLSSRMLQWTEGRMWMGAHIRRGDFLRYKMAMAKDPGVHIQRVKRSLQASRNVLVDLRNRGDWTTWDIEETQLDLNQTTLPLPQDDDPFFLATDERDPDALDTFAAAGAVFLSDLLTMEDRQTFGWVLMLTDVAAVVEQQVLVRGGFFYGHCVSSFAGAVVNMRASHGADPRTSRLD